MTKWKLTIGALALALVGLALALTLGRPALRALLRPEPPAPLTPLALTLPSPRPTLPPASPTAPPPSPAPPSPAAEPSAPPAPIAPPASPTLAPTTASSPTPGPPTPVVVGDRSYSVLLPAAVKNGQRYQYSCEFDAAWVIMQSYGLDVSEDELIAAMPRDERVEPYIVEDPAEGFLIYGGDIRRAFSGDYTGNFLARSTGSAFAQLFASYGLESRPVRTQEELKAALLRGELVWMKTTVDFKPWRPATWITPEGARIKTVLGNDHAVVAIGFSEQGVVIRDVLGPTSTGPDRPLEYEVRWDAFMAAWGAQDYDALAVARPAQ